MGDFFEAPPPRDEPPRYRTPEWVGPPEGTLPGVVPVERVLATTKRVAVCITRIAAYPTGFAFDVVTLTHRPDPEIDPLLFEQNRLVHRPAKPGIPPELLRFGVQFADGSKATNVGGRDFPQGRRNPVGPVMMGRGGGGGGGRWTQTQWVWPLPPPGPVAFVCEWPALDVPLTRAEFDAQVILDAADRAQVIFSEDDLPERPDDGGTAITVIG
jgi:hypothetical protein